MIERIFGVFKKRFQIFSLAPEYSIETQAKLVQALCVVHNFARIYDPDDIPRIEEDDEYEFDKGLLQASTTSAQKTQASNKRDRIAKEMWKSYQAVLKGCR